MFGIFGFFLQNIAIRDLDICDIDIRDFDIRDFNIQDFDIRDFDIRDNEFGILADYRWHDHIICVNNSICKNYFTL